MVGDQSEDGDQSEVRCAGRLGGETDRDQGWQLKGGGVGMRRVDGHARGMRMRGGTWIQGGTWMQGGRGFGGKVSCLRGLRLIGVLCCELVYFYAVDIVCRCIQVPLKKRLPNSSRCGLQCLHLVSNIAPTTTNGAPVPYAIHFTSTSTSTAASASHPFAPSAIYASSSPPPPLHLPRPLRHLHVRHHASTSLTQTQHIRSSQNSFALLAACSLVSLLIGEGKVFFLGR
ncbi:hypothetical protein BDV98DRAFT_575260 [Pterulicium gracile]|uniref:Uncharacterized protein n=1 Tax=Pterulicium gracile TaxID=1884261 RepID=A0A5C3Q9C6_9AGAR|nr:hypothetical protein BDV98DRAFT_575260 [Pterula gracilis]